MSEPLPLRPHHALCLRFFVGKGYGDDFVSGMAAVQNRLREHPGDRVVLTGGADRVCARCPNNAGGVCESAEKSSRYDEKCLSAFGLTIGQTLTWSELEQIALRVVLSPAARAAVCSDCRWDSVCREQQEKIRASR
ncbi:DUF1284 domain-containing protein [Caproicibacter sp.]|uniref:DUF1284 domain-containing protein n=1 Tax=Caproicibacter sp. TaxID=2814884 RepID=UPI0039899253